MNIETGDFFAVTRGFELGKLPDFSMIFSGPQYDYMGNNNNEKKEEKPHYDRSHEGDIYYAREVCGDMIAAVCVCSSSHPDHIGKVTSLNTREIDVWPLSKKYVESFGINIAKVLEIMDGVIKAAQK